MHSTEHLRCARDPFHGPAEDVQGQLQLLQDLAPLAVQTQALQYLKSHRITLVPAAYWSREDSLQTTCHIQHLQGLPASAQLQLDVLLGQVAGVLLRLQPLLQGVLITVEGQGDLREGHLEEETK